MRSSLLGLASILGVFAFCGCSSSSGDGNGGNGTCSGSACDGPDGSSRTGPTDAGADTGTRHGDAALDGSGESSVGLDAPVGDESIPTGMTVIASGLNGVQSIVTDDTNVYWVDITPAYAPVVRYCALTGCGTGPSSLAPLPAGLETSATLQELAIGMGKAYVAPGGNDAGAQALYESPLSTATGTAQEYATGADVTATLLATDSSYVYWADSEARKVYRCAFGESCASPSLVVDLSSEGETLQGIAVDAGTVYLGQSEDLASILTVPASGGSSTILCGNTSVGAPNSVASILVVGTTVYFADGETGIYECSTTTTNVFSVGTFVSDDNGPYGLATDGTYLYWVDGGTFGDSPTGSVVRCALGAACPSPTVLAASQTFANTGAPGPLGIAVSHGAAFWGTFDTSGVGTWSVVRFGLP